MEKPPSLFVGVPCYGSTRPEFEDSLMRFAMSSPIPVTIRRLVGSSLIPKARNILAAEFRETDCSHLLFLDSDLTFQPEDPLTLLSREVSVIGGYYARKTPGPAVWNVRTCPDNPPAYRVSGIQPLAGIGAGFLLIFRSVFETLINQFGDELAYQADGSGRLEYDFFPVGVRKDADGVPRYFGEDYGFCALCEAGGVGVFGDPSVKLGHIGTATFPIYGQEQ